MTATRRGKPARPAEQAIQFKVQLRYIQPPIWRRVVLPDNATLGDLHAVIQAAMGWHNCHMHSFRIGGVNGGDLEIVELYQEWEYCYSSGQSFAGAGAKGTSPGLAFGETGATSTTLGFEGASASSGPRTITEAVRLMGWADIADFSDSYDGFNEAQRAVVRSLLMALIAGE